MTSDPFEVVLRNMSMSLEDQIAIERGSDRILRSSIPDQFYACRTS